MKQNLTLDQLAALVGEAIGLEDDCTLEEIRDAEDLDDAIRRIKSVIEDAQVALAVLTHEKDRRDGKTGRGRHRKGAAQ